MRATGKDDSYAAHITKAYKWEFAEREGLQLVVLNPGTTLGPFFMSSVNTSLNNLLQHLRGWLKINQANGLSRTLSTQGGRFHRINYQRGQTGWLMRAKEPSKKLIDLGVCFLPFDVTIRETVDCFRSKGLI
ncbi:hypothetical protein ZEAMMB73_Zm00001d036609 [Zea mays]|uniref:NAD(P)-binding Rossmann-fold superfamily protein n=1 Tax=Zea mays TaxID=4577 RepID=A0A1D6LPU0_MAIZE|nr:hypothetical protein ZEAMMB73_Zm00001d036609 [Zea mays]AQK81508.1 hypothetical protein ZEAMMB73_Zm00001d036609 [Zea mays]